MKNNINMNKDLYELDKLYKEKAAKEANEFLLKYYGFNHWGDRWGPFGHPEKVLSKIADYVNAGAETIVIRFASFNPSEQLERLTENLKSQ